MWRWGLQKTTIITVRVYDKKFYSLDGVDVGMDGVDVGLEVGIREGATDKIRKSCHGLC